MIISRLYLPGIRASPPAMPSMVSGRLLSFRVKIRQDTAKDTASVE